MNNCEPVPARNAVGESPIPLHPPLTLAGVSIGMGMGCQQNDRTPADGLQARNISYMGYTVRTASFRYSAPGLPMAQASPLLETVGTSSPTLSHCPDCMRVACTQDVCTRVGLHDRLAYSRVHRRSAGPLTLASPPRRSGVGQVGRRVVLGHLDRRPSGLPALACCCCCWWCWWCYCWWWCRYRCLLLVLVPASCCLLLVLVPAAGAGAAAAPPSASIRCIAHLASSRGRLNHLRPYQPAGFVELCGQIMLLMWPNNSAALN